MKHLLLVLTSVMLLGYSTQSFAQSFEKEIIKEEKIILDDKNNESETIVEIKNGKLYVDGKKVADIDDDAEIKIIKKNTFAEKHDVDFDKLDMPFNMPRARAFGKVYRKAMLGVITENANPGASINEVLEGSAAEKAGLRKDDIITKIDDQKIETVNDLVSTIGEYNKGDEITIELERNNRKKVITARLGSQNNMPMEELEVFEGLPFGNFKELFKDKDVNVFRPNANKPKLGIEIEESENGLEILNVRPNSAAEKAGLQKGDAIKTIEGKEINTIVDLKKEILSNRNNKEIYFGVKRQGAIKSLPVVIPRAKKRAEF